jgi:hypothetical protein
MSRAALALAGLALAAAPVLAPRGERARPAVVVVSVGAEVATGLAGGARVTTVAHALTGGALRAGGRRASVLRVDAARDLAVLAVPGLHAAPAPPVAGVRILVRRGGRTVALPARVRRRITAHLRGATRRALELEASVEPGDSGAPVVAPGRLLGIVFARSTRRPDTAYAIDTGTG